VISPTLLTLLCCPRCGGHPAAPTGDLACAGCGAIFGHGDGYLIAPEPGRLAGRETHYASAGDAFESALAFQHIAQPFLGAGVRQRWLRRWLFDRPLGSVLEIGCGDGRFAYWNRARAHLVGLDAAALFSTEARATVDLVQGDARALPFRDGAFDAAYSIDVLEHLDADGLEALMGEARRVLRPGGRLFIFTNSREPSTFQPVIAAERRLAAALRRRGIGDFAADDLRKGDHVKALATFEDFERLAGRHGLRLLRRRFWNGIAQGFIDNVLIRAGEHLLLRRPDRRQAVGAAATSVDGVASAGPSARQALSRRRPVALALGLLTAAMQADVELLGAFRSGPFFALLERQ
jgi:SAM-dependent methyltransferase